MRGEGRCVAETGPDERPSAFHDKDGTMALTLITVGGLLSIAYGLWAISDVMKRDAGSPRMQEIAAAIAEGAKAYLRRQYITIAVVGVVLFVLIAYLLGLRVAVGFAI